MFDKCVEIVPKEPCVPRFMLKIDGKAVEEGDRVYFEGILDAQPHPTLIQNAGSHSEIGFDI